MLRPGHRRLGVCRVRMAERVAERQAVPRATHALLQQQCCPGTLLDCLGAGRLGATHASGDRSRESQRLPRPHERRLLGRFGHVPPRARLHALWPEVREFCERRLAAHRIALREPATRCHRAAPDAGPAMQIDAMARVERAVDHRHDSIHRFPVGRHAVVDDRLAQVFDATPRGRLERQQHLVARHLPRFCQVDEASDAGLEETAQALHRLRARTRTGVFAHQQSTGHDPIGCVDGPRQGPVGRVGGVGRRRRCHGRHDKATRCDCRYGCERLRQNSRGETQC